MREFTKTQVVTVRYRISEIETLLGENYKITRRKKTQTVKF